MSIRELAQKHGVNSDNIDEIILRISQKGKSHEFEDIKNSIKIPKEDLMQEQDTLAEKKKYNIELQKIQISSNVQEYIKENIILPKEKKKEINLIWNR